MYDGGYLISKINKLTSRKINELLKKFHVTEFNSAQGTILHILWNKPEMPIKEISAESGLAKTSLTTMLNRMEERGLIEKIENKNDKRSTIIRLTSKAKKLEKKYDEISNEMFYHYYRDFTEDEINTFENMLKNVLKNLEK